MIAAIQSGTATAVHSMKQGVERVAKGVDQAGAAGTAIQRVQSHSRQVVGAVDEISNALQKLMGFFSTGREVRQPARTPAKAALSAHGGRRAAPETTEDSSFTSF